jgi:hypothetical protein
VGTWVVITNGVEEEKEKKKKRKKGMTYPR